MQFVLITGVSTGIGLACTQYLIDEGFFVFGSVRKEEDAKRLEQDLGSQFKALLFDVTDTEAIQKAVKEVESILNGQGLTALVNNAGIAFSGPLQHLPIEKFQLQYDVNVMGVIRVTQAFLPFLGATKPQTFPPGKIINISSISGILTGPFVGIYASSKFALESLTDGFRRELSIYGIDAISIQPGPIKTPIWGKALKGEGAYLDTDYAPILAGMGKSIEKSEREALPAIAVAKVVHKAITLKRPKTRYIVTKNKWMIWFASRLIPDRMMDKFVERGLKKRIS